MKVGMVGARGYVGETLLRLLAAHPSFEVAWVSSSSQAGTSLRSLFGDDVPDLSLEAVAPGERHPEVLVLALPNDASAEWVAAHPDAITVDLSADHRFDDSWTYGLPERHREALRSARRIANPGCYATAAQLAIAPLVNELAAPPVVFGVSGYSGAGRTPSPRNDPERLRDNLMPYSLSGHVHEREISSQLGHDVVFTPHVASFFRGISATVSLTLTQPTTARELLERYQTAYADEPFVVVSEAVPEIAEIRERHLAAVGGFACDTRDPRRVVVVACLDNLLKGAASQALQNLNIACGFAEVSGLTPR